MAMTARQALWLAALVAISGCAGPLPGLDPGSPSATPMAPASYEEAVDGHAETLRAAGGFKLRRYRSVRFPDRVVNGSPVATEVVADLGADRYLLGEDLEGQNGVYRNGAWYQSGQRQWERVELRNGSTVYRRVPPDQEFTARRYTLAELRAMENFSTRFPLVRNGTAVFQGQRVTRYTADGLGAAEGCLVQSRQVLVEVRSVEVVALADWRGVIRKFECSLAGETNTGERVRQRLRWTVTGIGTVEVRPPSPLLNGTATG